MTTCKSKLLCAIALVLPTLASAGIQTENPPMGHTIPAEFMQLNWNGKLNYVTGVLDGIYYIYGVGAFPCKPQETPASTLTRIVVEYAADNSHRWAEWSPDFIMSGAQLVIEAVEESFPCEVPQ